MNPFISAVVAFSSVARVYGDCILTPQEAQDFANRDASRLNGRIAYAQIDKNPLSSVLPYGTTPDSSVVTRGVVQESAWLGHSMSKPNFVNSEEACGDPGVVAEVGSTEFSERLGTIRGRGPKVCVKTTRTDFAKSYYAATDSLEKGLIELRAADIQATLSERSGLKLVVRSGASFDQMLSGDINALDTPYTSDSIGLPDSPINWSLLKYINDTMTEEFMVEPLETKEGYEVKKVIGSQAIIESIRNQMDVREDHRAMTSGQIKYGEKSLRGYSFTGPYRGMAFGKVRYPRRFNTLGEDGQPLWVEPFIRVTTVSRGVARRPNPAYIHALYEEVLIIGANSFSYNTPKNYAGHGDFKFPRQLANGELQFKVIADNDCNFFEDFGMHRYQIERSYAPIRPHSVMSVIFKRCSYDFGLVPCDDEPYYLSGEEV